MDFAVKDRMVIVLPDHGSAVCDDAANTSCKATDPPSALALTWLDVRAAVGAPASAK